MNRHPQQQEHRALHIPSGATVMSNEEKECRYGGARRPNSIAWRGGQALIGMQLFGVLGLGLFFL